ncbi:MAG: hypothetical protein U1E34_03605 [Amaricoccus sp.]
MILLVYLKVVHQIFIKVTARRGRACMLVPLLAAALPALAQEAPYLDDRSDPVALIRSYYNAIDRQEYARAYSYFSEDMAPDYAGYVKGYAETAHVALTVGAPVSEGAAGSIYTTVPIALEATDLEGKRTVYAGCITARQVQPSIQEPPFRPIQIAAATLRRSDESLDRALPSLCNSQ